MNSFMNNLKNATNYKLTENGGVAHRETQSAVYDMFALGGAYRSRTNEDCIFLFSKAFHEDCDLALKCLFYLRDIRGGQGERRFFRVCFNWLCEKYPDIAIKLVQHISEYGRWDDVLYSCSKSPKVMTAALSVIKEQLALDIQSKTPSLLAKWLPSENASSLETKAMGNKVRNYLGMSHRQYRKTLSILRSKIKIVEKLMSENRWDEIEFDKIPSRAGLIYRNAFARRDIIAKKYEAFAKNKDATVNAKALYPYEIVAQAANTSYDSIDRAMLEKYWNNLPDYFEGRTSKMMCVVDTSGSMTGREASAPINVAISLGMYCAERLGGPFKDHFISFSHDPHLIKVEGYDFVDKVNRIYRQNLCENTNLTGVFDLLKNIALQPSTNKDDLPTDIVVISDMEIDSCAKPYSCGFYSTLRKGTSFASWTHTNAATEMEKVREEWRAAGLKLPHLTYWNVNARNDTILDSGPNVTFVSGFSPIIFESLLRGKRGIDLMYDKLLSDRYALISVN